MRAAAGYDEKAIESRSRILPHYSPAVRSESSGQVVLLEEPVVGNGEAQFRLARLLMQGRGIQKDEERAWNLIRLAAGRGYPPALAVEKQTR